MFPIPRDPPEGGTPSIRPASIGRVSTFPIPRDPPEGGTPGYDLDHPHYFVFPIPRDPPEGGTLGKPSEAIEYVYGFQFLGIPPKGERPVSVKNTGGVYLQRFPIPRDPPEGGTPDCCPNCCGERRVSNS